MSTHEVGWRSSLSMSVEASSLAIMSSATTAAAAVALVQARHRRQQPAVERVVVDRDHDRPGRRGLAVLGQEVGQRLGLQRLHRPHPAQQPFAGAGGAARRLAHHQDLAEPVFQRLDPLRHRRGGDRQPPRRGLETAFLEHGGEGGQLRVEQVHGWRLD